MMLEQYPNPRKGMAMANTSLARPAGYGRHAKLGRRQTIGRAAASAIEALEPRTLLSVDAGLQLDMALPYLPNTPKAIAPVLPLGVLAGSLTVPVLHSYPTAAVKIYLDFDGHAAMTWGSYSVTATPAYSIDTDPNSFSATELSNIHEIWERVSEKYSPFNVDVTTEDPGNTNDLQTVVAVIGGGGGWLGSLAGGVAYVGGFSNSAPNQVWVFPDNLGAGFPKYVGEATAHEVGHSFGLLHQSLYSGTTLVQQYYSGDANRAPIMGNSYSSVRGMWWNGTSSSSTTIQDDLAVIASPTNGFGYKVDDVGDTTSTAGTLSINNGNISASGIIGNTGDADYYILDIPVNGTMAINLNGPNGAMLDAKLEVRLSDGSVWLSSDSTPSTTESLSGSISAGRYYLVVRSHGGYGDIGQYTISGTVPSVNQAPTNISLSASSIAENQAAGTTVGTLSTTDPDAGNTFTYSLVSGVGSTDNASFTISGSTLQTAAIFNFEAKSSYSIRLRTTDQGGSWFEKVFTISVTNVNETPTDIALSANSIAENQPSGTAVGTLSSIDPDAGNTFTYTLVSGTGSTDNTSFAISGSTLQTAAIFNFEAKNSYSIRLRTTDQGGLWFEKAFTISVTNVNETPTDITLSASSVAENQSVGTAVGTLGTVDPDAGNTFTYSLVSGTGSTDNTSFTISGSTLQTAAIFDFEAKSSYSIRVRTTDQGGLWFEKTFTIGVLNVAEVVPGITGISTDTGGSASDGITSDPTLLINGTSEPGMTITIYRGGVLAGTTSANGSGNWTFDYTGTSLGDGSYSFTATAGDGLGNTTAASAPYAVTIDTAAPVTTPSFGGTAGTGGWYTSSVTVTLNESDAISGVAQTNYSLDGGSTWQAYSSPFVVSAQGSTSVQFYSTDVAGNVQATQTQTFKVDSLAPTVTGVYVRGSAWSSGFLSFLAANLGSSSSTYGFAIPVGSGSTQLQTLPWRNLNQISVAFSEDVSVAQAQFAIAGSVGSYSVSGFAYNPADHVATWSLSEVMGPDKLYIALPGTGTSPLADAAGNIMDGEWSNPSSYSDVGASDTFPSGNGTAGGDFVFRMDVLPGDSTGGSLGKVNVADINQTKSHSSLPETASSYRSDFDGNNLVNVADINYVKSKSSIYSLPADPPVLPVGFSPSLLLRSVEILLGNSSSGLL